MKYEVGKIIKGTVSGITDYGIFVTLDDYYSGLIHISEISDGYVKNVGDYAKIGDIITAKIIEVDHKSSHIKLSIKNIDYSKNKRYKRKKIIETSTGFTSLQYKLPFWIEENLKKIKTSEKSIDKL